MFEQINSKFVPDEILNILILIYGYNLEQNNNKKSSDHLENALEDCYIINSDWIKKLKDFYNYDSLSNIISKFKNFNCYSYEQFQFNINKILIRIKSFNLTQKGNDFNAESKMMPFFPEKIYTKMNSMHYYKEFYITNKKIGKQLYSLFTSIGDKVENNENNMNYELKYSLLKDNNALIVFANELEIGIIDKYGIFTPNYHIKYNNAQSIIIENEIKLIINQTDIEKFINSRFTKEGSPLQSISFPMVGKIGDILNIIELNKNNISNSSTNNNSTDNKYNNKNNNDQTTNNPSLNNVSVNTKNIVNNNNNRTKIVDNSNANYNNSADMKTNFIQETMNLLGNDFINPVSNGNNFTNKNYNNNQKENDYLKNVQNIEQNNCQQIFNSQQYINNMNNNFNTFKQNYNYNRTHYPLFQQQFNNMKNNSMNINQIESNQNIVNQFNKKNLLNKEINILRQKLDEEIIVNDRLNKKVNELERKNLILERELEEKNKQIKDLESQLKDNKNSKGDSSKNSLFESLIKKDKEIEELKAQLSRFLPYKLSEGEKLMSVIFQSIDQKMHISIICKNTDKFNKIESEIYEKEDYYQYSELDTFFTVKGKKINKYRTIEENGIKDNDVIFLNVNE